jgi:hypothetical protein
VYKRRRLVVLSVAVLLVLGFGRLLSWGSDGHDDDGDKAVQSAAHTTPSADPSDKKTKKGKGKKHQHQDKTPSPTPTPTPLAQPSGPCPDSDVLVTPSVPSPVAGRDVTIMLNLQTGSTEACYWRVSPDTVTLTVGAGPDDVWSSTECPGAIPSQDVVVRRAEATAVPVLWNAKRSDEYCTNRTAWVLPGVYQLGAAALGGEPTVVDVELVAPTPEVVTEMASPTQTPDQGKHKHRHKHRD